MSAPPFFQSAGRGDLLFWGEKEGADIAASPPILVALLICCSARNTAYVGDLYPAL